MGKPTTKDIALALGVNENQIVLLAKRGMPTNKIKNARDWFEVNGFAKTFHSKSGGAASSGPKLTIKIKSVLGYITKKPSAVDAHELPEDA